MSSPTVASNQQNLKNVGLVCLKVSASFVPRLITASFFLAATVMALLSIPNTLGAASIGYSVSCAVFGVMCVQLLTYYQRFPSDKLGYKLLVSRLSR